jgi:hypothetical protein
MRRAVCVVVAVLGCCPMGSFGQGLPSTPIALTDKITSLDGVWTLDPTKGIGGNCDLADQTERMIRIGISREGISVESDRFPKKLLPLDGSPVTVKDKTTASASLDAGWLAITTRVIAPMNRGATNVHRDVYIVSHGDLTVWRNFTVEWPDGSLGSPVCSYRGVSVYHRQT